MRIRELSRGDADLLADAFLAGVHRRGLRPGAMLAFSCPNSPLLLAAVFGCLHQLRLPIAGIRLTWTLNLHLSGPYRVVIC